MGLWDFKFKTEIMLNKEQVIEIIKNKKSSYPQILKAQHKETYDVINKFYENGRFSEKVYRWLNSDNIVGRCKECGEPTKFIDIDTGYRIYCSKKCSNVNTADKRAETLKETNKETRYDYYEKINCAICGIEFEALKYREQKCCSNACSGKYISQLPNRIDKIKATKLERYGDGGFVNPEKTRQTCLERYGVDNASKSPIIIEKIKESNLKKFGTEWSWQSTVIKDKIKEVLINKYGVDNVSKSPEIQEKKRLTTHKNYGVDNPFQSDVINEKIEINNLIKYGFKRAISNPNIIDQRTSDNRKFYYNDIIIRLLERCEYVIPLFTLEEYIDTFRDNKYKFQCKKCDDIFYDHIDGGHLPRCLKCNPHIAGFSYKELEFLDYLKVPDDDFHRQVTIYINENSKCFVDGLDIENKIIYEFLGDYYHGNPVLFEGSVYNEVCQKTHKELYDDTFTRLNNLKSIGYTIKYIWENDWNNFKNGIDKEPNIITLT